MYNFQKKATNKIEGMLESYCKNSKMRNEDLPKSKQKLAQKAVEMLRKVTNERPSANLECALEAMKLMKSFDDERVIYEMALARNSNMFCFLNYIRSYAMEERLLAIVCPRDEAAHVNRFIGCALKLWKMYLEK